MAKILIVDDAIFMRKMLSDILTKEGHKIIAEAGNAHEAVLLYKKLKPDVVTMDIVMPEIEHMTTLKAINAIKAMDKKAKIIMVSAMGQQEMVVETIQAGASDFIVKPFQATNIVKAVERLMNG